MFTYYSNGNRNQNKLAITFDDGPGLYTDSILKILARYKTKATFFVLGKKCEKEPELLKKIADQGHLLGNHGYNHARFSENFRLSEELIKTAAGKPVFIRPPYGNLLLCMKLLKNKTYKVIRWDVNPRDYRSTPNRIVQHVTTNAENGSIVLLHDTLKQTHTALPGIMRELTSRFRLVRLDELELVPKTFIF